MVEVFKAISADGSTCHFGDKSGAIAWAGSRGRVENVQLPDPPELGVIVGGGDPFAAVFNVLGIGSQSRTVEVLLANIENMQRRERCLRAIEREFFTVQTPPDPDEDGDEPGEECLLRWGADPVDYVEQFRSALPGAVARGVPVRCPLCRYQHGHAIGCANNPVDIALAAGVLASDKPQQENPQ